MSTWLGEQPTQQPNAPRAVGQLEEICCEKFNRGVLLVSALKGLEDLYVIDDRSAVAGFIERNRLRGLLLSARDPLNDAFGEASVKKLKLIRDDEGFETLFCLVLVSCDLAAARHALRSFDQRWWLRHSDQAAGRLNFDFELF
jgi:hypothetical protein